LLSRRKIDVSDELHASHPAGFHGPKCWVLTLLAGLALGFVLAKALPQPAALTVDDLSKMKSKTVEEFKAESDPAFRKPDVQPERDRHGEKAGEATANSGHGAEAPVHWSKINAPNVPLYLSIPFALLLLAIALMPFINQHFWEHHYPDFAFLLGGLMVSYYLFGLNAMTTLTGVANYGLFKMEHVGLEYFQFLALVGSLYVVTGGVLIDIKGKAGTKLNVTILIIGAVIANLIGTTGAAALLIRSYIRINKHRIKPFHILFFIFIVANCGGCLTPIGDPPLFLGYLQGVPFAWTVVHCLPAWATAVGLLVLMFYIFDVRALAAYEKESGKEENPEKNSVRISGLHNFIFLGVVLFGVFFDEIFHTHGVGAILQVVAAAVAYKFSKKECLQANEFTFGPIREVGFLFFGLFATMVPALEYLALNAQAMGVASPTAFYFASGSLSSFLDNAPTYLNFFSAAHGLSGLEMGKSLGTPAWMALEHVGQTGFTPNQILLAISLSSVFFGSNTYIGNAPNFMVKAISESAGVKMPSFFGYIIRYTIPIMLPVLIVIWVVFVSGWVL
jgi:Na+/H+ antiporter NhaD/arsenite permease-like protein